MENIFELYPFLNNQECSPNIIDSLTSYPISPFANIYPVNDLLSHNEINSHHGDPDLTPDPSFYPSQTQKSPDQTGFQEDSLLGYMCFSSASGETVKRQKRSKFTNTRRKEVLQVRKRGACLRCQMRKKTCSGEDPCKACSSMALSKLGSRVLGWMECVRPSFEAMDIFEDVREKYYSLRIEDITESLLPEDEPKRHVLPFDLNIQSVATFVVHWLINGPDYPGFSVRMFLRSKMLADLLYDTLGDQFCHNFRLLVYSTLVSAKERPDNHRALVADELHIAGQHAGAMILKALEQKLKPSSLAASKSKAVNLLSLFLVIFGLSLIMRYIHLNAKLQGLNKDPMANAKVESLMKLFDHYLAYIGEVVGLIGAVQQNQIMETCRFQRDWPEHAVVSRSGTHPALAYIQPLRTLNSSPFLLHIGRNMDISIQSQRGRIIYRHPQPPRDVDGICACCLELRTTGSTKGTLHTPACQTNTSHLVGESPPIYWIFFNQYEPVRIHSQNQAVNTWVSVSDPSPPDCDLCIKWVYKQEVAREYRFHK